MVGEGVWPKADGDILFSSEVNSFRQNGFFLFKNNFDLTGTGSIGGSIVIPPGSLSPICSFNIMVFGSPVNSVNNIQYTPKINLSGGAFGANINWVDQNFVTGSLNVNMIYTGILGSNVSVTRISKEPQTFVSRNPLEQSLFFNSFPNSGLVISFGAYGQPGSIHYRAATLKFEGFFSGTNIEG